MLAVANTLLVVAVVSHLLSLDSSTIIVTCLVSGFILDLAIFLRRKPRDINE